MKNQDKKINELATREQIKTLETADNLMKAQLELELEQLQQFLREVNVKVSETTGKVRGMEVLGHPKAPT